MAAGPLAGVRVLDAATMLAGPFGCQLLGDLGADVIKIEHPRLGDSLRGHGRSENGIGLWWKIVARNKRCVALDLGEGEGAEIFLELVRRADVVVESFRPGTIERWGLGPDVLLSANPSLVLVRVSGFGQTGPYAPRAGFGTLAEAMSGFAAMTGDADGPPVLPPFGLADGVAGLTIAYATLAALYRRDAGRDGEWTDRAASEPDPQAATRTPAPAGAGGGGGQVIDLSILEPLVTVLGAQATVYDRFHEVPKRTGNRSSNNAPRNTYRTADGKWVAVSTSALNIAERVMRLVGHPEVAREEWFATGAGRAAHGDLLDDMVASWVSERSREEVMAAFSDAGAAIAPVYDVADLVADEHVVARETFVRVPDPDLGSLLMPNVVARFSATPGSIRSTGRALGADTDDVLAEAGIDPERVEALRAKGVLR